jgi:ribonuclease D
MNFITDISSLTSFCQQLQEEDQGGFIAVDTEFIREETFWPKLCLIQIAGSKRTALIDPLVAGLDLNALFSLMVDPRIIKVFHAARQDIEIFFYLTQTIPKPIFDTQVAAMVSGFGEAVGYDSLVQSLIHATIDKSQRFTDWSKRPLSEKQLKYALQDVTYLRTIYEHLKCQLDKTQRTAWIEEEMAALESPQTYAISPQDAWKRVKTRSESPDFLARVQALAAFRETTAMALNVPRTRIFRDQILLKIAAQSPQTFQELSQMRGVPKYFLNQKQGTHLLDVLKQAQGLPSSKSPRRLQQPAKTSGAEAVVELFKVWLKQVCYEHNVAQKLVATSADLEMMAVSLGANVPALKGWRYEIFGRDAVALKEGRAYLTVENNKLTLVKKLL